MSRSEWNDDESYEAAPLPAHERVWRHPSEMGEQAWVMSEPPLAIGRGLTVATGTIGCVLALAVLWTMLPTQAGRDAESAVRSTLATRTDSGLTTERTEPSATDGSLGSTAISAVASESTGSSLSAVPTTAGQTQNTAAATTTPARPLHTYQVQQGSTVTEVAVAVAVNGGTLVVTTAQAVSADLTVELMLPDGNLATARVLFVDDRSGLAVLAPETASGAMAFAVASEIVAGDELTFFGDEPTTVVVTDDLTIPSAWADDSSIIEGTPVVNQRGELVALCSHDQDGAGRLVQLSNLDQLQQAIGGYPGSAKVWLGVVLNDDPAGQLSIGGVDPAGPAALAGLTSGDVIVSVDGVPVANGQALTDALTSHVPGDVVQLTIIRADATETVVSVTLAAPKTTL